MDPVTTNATNGTFFNRYEYAKNNPYKFKDPDGRSPCTGTRIESACGTGYNTAPIGDIGATRAAANNVIAQRATSEINSAVRGAKNLWSIIVSAIAGDEKKPDEPSKPAEPKEASKDKAKDVPNRGQPGEVKEGQRRTREYGSDGKPVRDYDKPHQGHERPHVHEWENGVREHPGRDYSPWPKQGS